MVYENLFWAFNEKTDKTLVLMPPFGILKSLNHLGAHQLTIYHFFSPARASQEAMGLTAHKRLDRKGERLARILNTLFFPVRVPNSCTYGAKYLS